MLKLRLMQKTRTILLFPLFLSFLLYIFYPLPKIYAEDSKDKKKIAREFDFLAGQIRIKDLTRDEFEKSAIRVKKNPLFDIRLFYSQRFLRHLDGRKKRYRVEDIKEQLEQAISFIQKHEVVAKKILAKYNLPSNDVFKVDFILHAQPNPDGLIATFCRSPEKIPGIKRDVDILKPSQKNTFEFVFKDSLQPEQDFHAYSLIFYSPSTMNEDYPIEFSLKHFQFAHELFHVVQKLYGVSIDSPNADGSDFSTNLLTNPVFIEGTPEVFVKYLLEEARKKDPFLYQDIAPPDFEKRHFQYPFEFLYPEFKTKGYIINYAAYRIWYSGKDFVRDYENMEKIMQLHKKEREGFFEEKYFITNTDVYKKVLKNFAASVFKFQKAHFYTEELWWKSNEYGVVPIDLKINPYTDLRKYLIPPQALMRFVLRIPANMIFKLNSFKNPDYYSMKVYNPSFNPDKSSVLGSKEISLLCFNEKLLRPGYLSDFIKLIPISLHLMPIIAPGFPYVPIMFNPQSKRKYYPFYIEKPVQGKMFKLEIEYPEVLVKNRFNHFELALSSPAGFKSAKIWAKLQSNEGVKFDLYWKSWNGANFSQIGEFSRIEAQKILMAKSELKSEKLILTFKLKPHIRGSFLIQFNAEIIEHTGTLLRIPHASTSPLTLVKNSAEKLKVIELALQTN
ncbi:hypothetical protein ACFL35_12735 [Candidatus Riflebacteria bacterium]